jgi:hypothetical protein
MLRRRTIARAVSTVALLLAPRAHAQDSTAHPPSGLLGAGINLQGGGGAPLALQLGKEWRAKDSRFGVRLVGEYTRSTTGTRYFYDISTFTPASTFAASDDAFSLGLQSTYAFGRGRIQPYLLSGVVLQAAVRHATSSISADAPLPPGVDAATRRYDYVDRRLVFGMEAGGGIQARIGTHWIYGELRKQLTSNAGLGVRNAAPLTFGLRF